MDLFDRLDFKGKVILILVIINLFCVGGFIYYYNGKDPEKESQLTETKRNIVVHLTGEVNQPDVYVVPEGTYLYELIKQAGGITENADLSYINLAQELMDGMRITIPGKKPQSGSEIDHDNHHKININTATKEELMKLDGIGEVKARRIIEYRSTVGPFQRIEDIMRVNGIGVKTFEAIKGNITV